MVELIEDYYFLAVEFSYEPMKTKKKESSRF